MAGCGNTSFDLVFGEGQNDYKNSYHPFRANDKGFIYDFASGQLVHIDEATFEFLEKASRENRDLTEVEETVAETLKAMRAHGLLFRSSAEVIAPPYCSKCVGDVLQTSVEQMCLEVTTSCNLRCRYCAYSGSYSQNRAHGHQMMNWETAKGGIDFYLERSSKSKSPVISFYGGEPMLNFEIVERTVEYVCSHYPDAGVRFSIDTNGTLVEDHHIDYFIENNFILQISLDGPKEVHDANRVFINNSGTFAKVISVIDAVYERSETYFIENLVIAITMSPPYPVTTIADFFSREPYRELNVIPGFVDTEGVNIFDLLDVDNTPEVWSEFRALKDQYFKQMLNNERDRTTPFARSLFDQEIIDLLSRLPRKADGKISCNGICVPGGRKLFITVEGGLYPCEKVGGDFRIGDVRTGFDRAAIDRYVNDYKEVCEKNCHDCWAASLCRLCFATVRRNGYISEARKSEECDFERMYWHNALVNTATIQDICPKSLDFVKHVIVM